MATPVSTYHVAPYASHMSLFLADRENYSEVDYSSWHHADVARRRVIATVFELQIATARDDVVPVRLRVLNEAPPPNLAADHVVETDLQVPSGKLVLHTVDDDWNEVPNIPIAPGRYRVRVTYQPCREPIPGTDADAPGDHFDYLIDLWPAATAAEPETLVQGPELWAG